MLPGSPALNLAAKYFINELRTDPLKLQKLLYFTQGISFCMNDEEFFEEQFEAWVHGPVVRDVYMRYRNYGYSPIDITYALYDISTEQLAVLEYVKTHYGKYDGPYLEKLTHAQEPWQYARRGLDPDERADKTIPKEVIADYFSSLMFQPSGEEWTE